MSLAFAKQIMEMKLDPDDKNFPRVLAAKQSVASSIMTAAVRTKNDELNTRSTDKVAQLLEEIEADEVRRALMA